MKKTIVLVLLSVSFCLTALAQEGKKPAKLTAEEVISKHLASIGTADSLAAVKSRVMIGRGRLLGGVGTLSTLSGPAQFASDGDKIVFAMLFNSNEYPYEKVGFDGEDLTVGKPSGGLTELSKFLKSHSSIVKQGLFGGTLSSAWPLLDLAQKKGKPDYDGTATISGRLLHKVKFRPKGGSINVMLFFEDGTFRHVLTEYKYTQSAGMSSNMIENSRRKPSYFTMVEQFSNFKTYNGLTLPSQYTIDVSAVTEEDTFSLKWDFVINEVYFNETLEAGAFKVS